MKDENLIEFEHVSFQYDEQQPRVLNDVQFKIKKADWVSIVGHNGSGKSTLAKLLTGIEQDFTGDIKVNGNSIKGKDRPAFHLSLIHI